MPQGIGVESAAHSPQRRGHQRSTAMQSKLRVDSPGTIDEQEADRLAREYVARERLVHRAESTQTGGPATR